ncbi:MAG TPA: HEAT repeat domain-containing protein, partial [Planctomycetota bacterium]|nr:HEAT repeat domain-containing protein [Planctomycetota bacterium]
PAAAATTEGAARPAEPSAPLSAEDARRLAALKKLEERYEKAKSAEDRADLLDKIGQLGAGGAPAIRLVDAACADPEPLVRAFAVKARVALGGPDAAKRVAAAFADADAEVRVAAAEASAGLSGDDRFLPALEAARRERDPRVQEALFHAAEVADDPKASGVVAALLKNQERPDAPSYAPRALLPALRFLRKRPADAAAAAEPIAELLNRDDAEVRAQSATTLGALDVRTSAVKIALARGLTDLDRNVRRASADVLKRWAGEDFGYDPDGADDARRAAVRKFRDWAEK